MAALASSLSSLPLPRCRYRNHHRPHLLHGTLSLSIALPRICSASRKIRSPIVSASSAGAPYEELDWNEGSVPDNSSKVGVLLSLFDALCRMGLANFHDLISTVAWFSRV